MRRVDSALDRLDYRHTLGVVRLFGLPFFIAAVAIVVSIALGRLRTASGTPAGVGGIVGPVVVALTFAVAGAALLFYRRGIAVDRPSRTVAAWWGIVVPLSTKRRRLDEFDRVQVTQVRNADATWHFVEFAGATRERFQIAALEKREEADRIAREISAFTGLRRELDADEDIQS